MKAFTGSDFLLETDTAKHLYHNHFRRIMCSMIGSWVETGEYPSSEKSLKKIAEGISYNNAALCFDL